MEPGALKTWATEHGCEFYLVRVSPHPSYGGLGLFNSIATSPDANRTTVFIPNSLIISIELIAEAADESEELADILNSLNDIPTSSVEHLVAIFLLYQVHLTRTGNSSHWSTYIDNLPKSSLVPIAWNSHELSLLSFSGISISRAVHAKLRSLRAMYDILHGQPGWFQSILWEDYLLAQCWVSSRTIEHPETNQPILVPILDMANHSPLRNAAWEVTENGIEVRREPVAIAADEELTISYDLDRGTGERLYRYGFLEDPSESAMTKSITLLTLTSIPHGTKPGIFTIPLSVIRDSFQDLSFLTYSNWITILSREHNTSSLLFIGPSHQHPTPRLINLKLEPNQVYDIPDLSSLLETLHHPNIFRHARNRALVLLNELVKEFLEKIWLLSDEDDELYDKVIVESMYSEVRREVWKLLKTCAIQEGGFCVEMEEILEREIRKYYETV